MKFEFRTEFSVNESENLWGQGVCLDDWDYAFITHDIDQFEVTEDMTIDYDHDGKRVAVPCKIFSPKEYTLTRILTGCCDNRWYPITWEGKEAVIGLAYHA